ncbi:uncharacterized protein [Dysidea avara]|uniref:uncharacterized protein isoform X2 n=1 Tax=Dysidea avara TaxID=196820 RepID=UPI003318DD7E
MRYATSDWKDRGPLRSTTYCWMAGMLVILSSVASQHCYLPVTFTLPIGVRRVRLCCKLSDEDLTEDSCIPIHTSPDSTVITTRKTELEIAYRETAASSKDKLQLLYRYHSDITNSMWMLMKYSHG